MNELFRAIDVLIKGEEDFTLHSKRVMELASSFAIYMSLSYRSIVNLRIGAFFHDIGKTIIPKEILLKPEPLTDEDFEIIKSHAQLGYELFIPYKDCFAEDILDIIVQHHEKMDKTGYPNKLSSKQINPLSKIVSLCDSFDAMTNSRIYKKALSTEVALSEIKKGLGTQFDNDLGVKFIDYIENYYKEEEMVV